MESLNIKENNVRDKVKVTLKNLIYKSKRFKNLDIKHYLRIKSGSDTFMNYDDFRYKLPLFDIYMYYIYI